MGEAQKGIAQVTNEQLYPAVGIPLLVNVALWLAVSARIGSVETGLNKRIEDMRDLLRAEIRVGIAELKASLEARLTRLEEKVDRFEGQRIIR